MAQFFVALLVLLTLLNFLCLVSLDSFISFNSLDNGVNSLDSLVGFDSFERLDSSWSMARSTFSLVLVRFLTNRGENLAMEIWKEMLKS